MKNFSVRKILILFSVLFVSFPCFAQKKEIVKQVIEIGRSSGKGGILQKMDFWYKSGEVAALNRNLRSALRRPVEVPVHPVSKVRLFREEYLGRSIYPTQASSLHIRLQHPTHEQVQNAVSEYENLFADFQTFRKEFEPKLINLTFSSPTGELLVQERRELITEISSLSSRARKLSSVVFSDDAALAEMNNYLTGAMKMVNPFYVPTVGNPRSDKRVFVHDEFFLEAPKDAGGLWRVSLKNELPKNMRVAVLNDSQEILDMYRVWQSEKRLPEGWNISLYDKTLDLVKTVSDGQAFDLIITDIVVPGGGGYYLVDQLRNLGFEAPIIGCSGYKVEQLEGEKMLNVGFDGYFHTGTIFEESSGYVLWESHLKAYYYYKDLKSWQR